MPDIITGTVIGGTVIGAYGDYKAGQDRASQIRQQYEIDTAYASDALALSHQQAEYSYGYADQIVELAGQRLEIAKQSAAFSEMQGQYAVDRGLVIERQFDQNANTEEATSQRTAISQEEQTRAIANSGIAAAAAGGILVEDVASMIGEVKSDGRYSSLMSLWQGMETARGLRYQGDIARHDGEVTNVAKQYEAALTLAEGNLGYQYSLLEAENIRFGASQALAGAQLEADNVARGGSAAESAASASSTAGTVGALGTLIGGVSRLPKKKSES